MHADRLRQVLVAFLIARNHLAQYRQDLERIQVVKRLDAVRRFRELQDQRLAAGFQNPVHGRKRSSLDGDVSQAKGDCDTVETGIGERQVFGIDLCNRQVAGNTRVDQSSATLLKHCMIDIGENHLARFANLLRKLAGQITRTAREIEDSMARFYAGLVDREALPYAVQTAGHQVVHDVVARRDRVENVFYKPRFFGYRYGLVAEVGFVGRFVVFKHGRV